MHLGRKRPKKVYAVGKEPEGADLIDLVSGVADAAKRNIPCSVEGCSARFIRHHDLTLHIRSQHGDSGLVDGEQQLDDTAVTASYGQEEQAIAALGVGQVGKDGDVPQIGQLEDQVFVDPELQLGQEFWSGASNDMRQDERRAEIEFEREWSEMRRLIDIDALLDG